jgi:predicted dehydrogenase
MDDRYEIVTGILSSDIKKSKKAAQELGIAPGRIYDNVSKMLQKEAKRKDGADVVAIMTPNDTHYPYAIQALDLGFDVICDKPMTNSLEDAEALHTKVKESGLVFCLTHNYTGYPMVRQAKAMVKAGQLGVIRLVQVEYVQSGKAKENDPDPRGMVPWRYNPAIGGPSLVLGDIGTHAHNLLRYITGLEVGEVAAEVGHVVPNRVVHDFAGALLRLENGARGVFWVTQAAAGVENSLRIRISGTKGSIEWMQEEPQFLTFKPLEGPAELRTTNGEGTLPFAAYCCRVKRGHPEGFPAGFANIYSDAAEAIAARRSGKTASPHALHFPNAYDGLLGVRFMHQMLESSTANGQWVNCIE